MSPSLSGKLPPGKPPASGEDCEPLLPDDPAELEEGLEGEPLEPDWGEELPWLPEDPWLEEELELELDDELELELELELEDELELELDGLGMLGVCGCVGLLELGQPLSNTQALAIATAMIIRPGGTDLLYVIGFDNVYTLHWFAHLKSGPEPCFAQFAH